MFHSSCDASGSLLSEWVWGTSVLIRGFPVQQQHGAVFWKVVGDLGQGQRWPLRSGVNQCGKLAG